MMRLHCDLIGIKGPADWPIGGAQAA